MIEPGKLHRYFKVREIKTGRDMWLMNGDVRYERSGPGMPYGYRITPDGAYFLACADLDYGFGWPLMLNEVEPLPDGAGLYGGTPDCLHLAMTYEGSWRQAADLAAITEGDPQGNAEFAALVMEREAQRKAGAHGPAAVEAAERDWENRNG